MSKFVNVNHETFQSWYVYMQDLMSQKKAWLEMVRQIPERNMAQTYQHKVVDICPFAGKQLAAEFMANENQNNICFYLVDKDGDDDGTHFLCGNHIGTDKFDYTNHKFAADIAGSVYAYLTKNGYLTY